MSLTLTSSLSLAMSSLRNLPVPFSDPLPHTDYVPVSDPLPVTGYAQALTPSLSLAMSLALTTSLSLAVSLALYSSLSLAMSLTLTSSLSLAMSLALTPLPIPSSVPLPPSVAGPCRDLHGWCSRREIRAPAIS